MYVFIIYINNMITDYNFFLIKENTNTILKGSQVGYNLTINNKNYKTITGYKNMKFNPIIVDCVVKNNKIYNLDNILLSNDNYIQ